MHKVKSEKIKVAIIGTNGVPAKYGGYETLVENLILNKSNAEIEYTVFCSSKIYNTQLPTYNGAKLRYIPLKANGWQAIIYDIYSMIIAVRSSDVVLSLGTLGSFILPFIKPFIKKKIIFNLDGLDSKREKWNFFQRLIIETARRMAVFFSDAIIADNEVVRLHINDIYKKDSVLIEYGGDNAQIVSNDTELLNYGLKPKEYFFKVARIEPENNIEMILKAFSLLEEESLVIVGNWNKSRFGQDIREKYTMKNIFLLDPIYDAYKLNLLRSNCKAYVHGHSAGGTNPSLVEAMNLRLPIMAYDVNFNVSTTENEALYFKNYNDIISLVKNYNRNTFNLIGDNMQNIAEKRYRWEIIAGKYEKTIGEIIKKDKDL